MSGALPPLPHAFIEFKGTVFNFLMGAIMEPSSEDLFTYLSGRKPKSKFVGECKMLQAKYDTPRLYVNFRYLWVY